MERTTTAGDVTQVLRQRILQGEYASGQFIRQDAIANELGVSRIPVREALAQLEAEGLVIREKFRGAFVRKLTLTEIEQIYDLRLLIEPYLLRHAMEHIQSNQIARLREIVARSRLAQTLSDWAGLNVEFHRTLFEAAGKPLALQVLDNLLLRADRYLKIQRLRSTATREESDAEHMRILELVEQGSMDRAVVALRKHISWNAEDVCRSILDSDSGSTNEGE